MPPRDLTEGSVPKLLFGLAGPAFGGLIAGLTFSLVDTLFVSWLGQDALTAISFTFPVTMGGMGLAIGFSSATASLGARALGAGEPERARRVARDAVLLVILAGSAILLGLWPLLTPIFKLMGAPDSLMELIWAYVLPWSIALPIGMVAAALNATLRASGNTRAPAANLGVFAEIVQHNVSTTVIGQGTVTADPADAPEDTTLASD